MRGPCLSKQVCQACKRVRHAEFDHAYRTLFKGTDTRRESLYREMAERPAWTDRDEHDWHERGVVNCVKDGPGFSVDGPPPKGCPYIFEHTVSQQQLARGPCSSALRWQSVRAAPRRGPRPMTSSGPKGSFGVLRRIAVTSAGRRLP